MLIPDPRCVELPMMYGLIASSISLMTCNATTTDCKRLIGKLSNFPTFIPSVVGIHAEKVFIHASFGMLLTIMP